MASQIITVVLFTAFFSEGLTLTCYNCTLQSDPCPNCTSGTQCISNITYYGDAIHGNKGCVDQCVSYSVNVGFLSRTVQCCSSDMCNNITTGMANEKRCYTCNGTDCSQTVSCKGDETQCITVKVDSNTYEGCASKSICQSTILQSYLNSTKTDVSCCDGNLCNSGQSLIQGAVLLVFSLILHI